jgi:hypothetical protein
MDIGYGYASWIAGEKRSSWRAERTRTKHYPVLD